MMHQTVRHQRELSRLETGEKCQKHLPHVFRRCFLSFVVSPSSLELISFRFFVFSFFAIFAPDSFIAPLFNMTVSFLVVLTLMCSNLQSMSIPHEQEAHSSRKADSVRSSTRRPNLDAFFSSNACESAHRIWRQRYMCVRLCAMRAKQARRGRTKVGVKTTSVPMIVSNECGFSWCTCTDASFPLRCASSGLATSSSKQSQRNCRADTTSGDKELASSAAMFRSTLDRKSSITSAHSVRMTDEARPEAASTNPSMPHPDPISSTLPRGGGRSSRYDASR
mmetsp:Transcript_3591/g.10209  ORF Transcript_3591/g.10209 Transcript_3591/m.10209 type:complete len:279 (-) Transcript_3591:226-1062(-)